MKKFFEQAKDRFSTATDDDKAAMIVAGIFVVFIVVLLLILVAVLIQELFVPALIGVALYSAGIKLFNWPIPKFVKKLFK